MSAKKKPSVSWREVFGDPEELRVGDTFDIPAVHVKACVSRLNQHGFNASTRTTHPGRCAVTIMGTKPAVETKPQMVRALRALPIKQLRAVVKSCRQAGLLPPFNPTPTHK